jgi:hypothetical protein
MTVSGKITNKDRAEIFKNITKKINTGDKKKLAKTLGAKLIKNIDDFSESVERNRISDEIGEEIEIMEEKRKIPPGFASVKEITKWAERNGLLEKCSCGHEKIYHIDKSIHQEEVVKSLEHLLGICKIKKCKCRKFVELTK